MNESKAHQREHQHLIYETSMPDTSEIRPVLRVLVLGSTGFIGRHAAAALNASGAEVVIGSRHPLLHAQGCPYVGFRPARFESLVTPDVWTSLLVGIDAVVRCVGILRQRLHESYDAVRQRLWRPHMSAMVCIFRPFLMATGFCCRGIKWLCETGCRNCWGERHTRLGVRQNQ